MRAVVGRGVSAVSGGVRGMMAGCASSARPGEGVSRGGGGGGGGRDLGFTEVSLPSASAAPPHGGAAGGASPWASPAAAGTFFGRAGAGMAGGVGTADPLAGGVACRPGRKRRHRTRNRPDLSRPRQPPGAEGTADFWRKRGYVPSAARPQKRNLNG